MQLFRFSQISINKVSLQYYSNQTEPFFIVMKDNDANEPNFITYLNVEKGRMSLSGLSDDDDRNLGLESSSERSHFDRQ